MITYGLQGLTTTSMSRKVLTEMILALAICEPQQRHAGGTAGAVRKRAQHETPPVLVSDDDTERVSLGG